MSVAYDVLQYLASEAIGTEGVDLFVGTEPSGPPLCATLYDTGGEIGESWAGWDSPTIMVRVRALNYLDGYALAKAIRDLLILPPARVFGAWHYTGFWLINDIARVGRDDRNREIFSLNIRLMREPNIV